MRTLLVVLLAIPLTAVLTAGATVLALTQVDAWWPDATAAAASLERPVEIEATSAPAASAPTAEPELVSDEIGSPEAAGASPAVVEPETAELPRSPAMPEAIAPRTATIEATGFESPESPVEASLQPVVEPAMESTATHSNPGAESTVDFLKLSDDLHEISDQLERFNRKLLEVIAASEERRQAADRSAQTPESEDES